MTERSKHDAPGQLSGYLYQVLAALLLLLETKNPDAQICIERFDDIAFVEDDTPQIMIQTKHQLNRPGNLNDTSVDLWRTINSWCDSIKTYGTTIADTSFLIVTTAIVKDKSATAYLTQSSHRDWIKAKEILRNIAETDKGVTNQSSYTNYMSLSEEERDMLVKHIFIYDIEENIVKIYALLAMYVELGLPNSTAANIYMAGVRSRRAALELSTLEIFRDKNVSEIKRIILELPLNDFEVSGGTQSWIELLYNTAKAQIPRRITFPIFTWDRDGLPDRLYIRKINDECFLVSSDGFFYETTESTEELPFSKIANINGLYLARNGNEWHLKSYNPLIVIRQ